MCTILLWVGPTFVAYCLVGRASWWQCVPQAKWREWLCICVPILASRGGWKDFSIFTLSHLCCCFPHVGACWAGAAECVDHKTIQCLWYSTMNPGVSWRHSGIVSSCPNNYCNNFSSVRFQTLCKLGTPCHQLSPDLKITGEMMYLLSGQIWLDTIWEDSEYYGGHGQSFGVL